MNAPRRLRQTRRTRRRLDLDWQGCVEWRPGNDGFELVVAFDRPFAYPLNHNGVTRIAREVPRSAFIVECPARRCRCERARPILEVQFVQKTLRGEPLERGAQAPELRLIRQT